MNVHLIVQREGDRRLAMIRQDCDNEILTSCRVNNNQEAVIWFRQMLIDRPWSEGENRPIENLRHRQTSNGWEGSPEVNATVFVDP